MNKKDFVRNVADISGLSVADSTKAVTAVMDTIADTLKKGEDVNFAGFLKLTKKKREARVGRNPKTGDQINIPAAWVVKVTVGKILKDIINK